MRATPFLVTLALVALACGDDTTTPLQADFIAEGTSFTPSSVNATASHRTIVWGIGTGGPHNVTFDDGAPSSGNLTEGSVFQRNFTGVAGGTVRFRCTNHSSSFTVGMVGTVEVQ